MQGGQVFAPHRGSRSGGVGNILAPFGFALITTSLNLSGYKFDKFNDFFICPALRTQVLNQAKNFAACHFVHFPFTCLFYIHGLRRVDLISRRPRTEPVPFSGASRGLVPLGSVVRWFCSTSDRLKITRLRRGNCVKSILFGRKARYADFTL